MAHTAHANPGKGHEAAHDRIIKHLDNNDHLTQRRGGDPTHGTQANFKAPELSERDKSAGSGASKDIIHAGK